METDMSTVRKIEFLEVAECLPRLPVKMAEREFRKRVRDLGLCYKHGHQIKLDEHQLDAFIETLKCQTLNSTDAAKSGTSGGRSKSQGRRGVGEFAKAQAMLD
jgi:hypothetical protein